VHTKTQPETPVMGRWLFSIGCPLAEHELGGGGAEGTPLLQCNCPTTWQLLPPGPPILPGR
jgi:hypothetical protein